MKWASNVVPAQPFAEAEEDAALAALLEAHCGKLSGSRMREAMDFLKNGNPSAKRTDLLYEKLSERLTRQAVRHFVTTAMQWGTDTEPEAKLMYVEVSGHKLHPAESIYHPSIPNFLATPDGLVGNDGLLEVKCPTTSTFIEWRLAGLVPDEYKPQMLAQIACTKRQWVDFFAYDPRIKDKKLNHFLRRYEPNKYEIEQVEAAAMKFLEELDNLFDRFVNAA